MLTKRSLGQLPLSPRLLDTPPSYIERDGIPSMHLTNNFGGDGSGRSIDSLQTAGHALSNGVWRDWCLVNLLRTRTRSRVEFTARPWHVPTGTATGEDSGEARLVYYCNTCMRVRCLYV